MSTNSHQTDCHVLVATGGPDDLRPLLNLGYSLAKANEGRLTVLTVSQLDHRPDWFEIPSEFQDIPLETEVIHNDSPAHTILKYARQNSIDLLLVSWKGAPPRSGFLLGSTLDSILQQAPCNLMVVKAEPAWPEITFREQERTYILVPTSGGPNTPLAMDLALGLSEQSKVTALYVTSSYEDRARLAEREAWLAQFTRPWAEIERFKTKVVKNDDILEAILTEAKGYDITMLGASNETIFGQLLFGTFPQKIATQNGSTTIIVKQFDGSLGSTLGRLWWQASHILPQLSVDERMDVYKQIRRGARPKIDFFMMIGLATGIAALGLLVNSPAVIIGAMLVAPLMAAIMGLGLGMIQADAKLLRLAGSATLRGMLLAIGMGLLAGVILPAGEPTPEIVSRIRPSLFDLGVALISGLAGAYALCRKDVSSSLPGVAIAAALVPPLATVGVGLAWFDMEIARGALILFLTNLIAITAASGLIFFVLGFRPKLTKEKARTNLFRGGLFSSIVLLALITWVLWSLSIGSFREAALERAIEQVLEKEIRHMNPQAVLDSWKIMEPEEKEEKETLRLRVQIRSPFKPAYPQVVELQDRVVNGLRAAGELDLNRPLGLILVVIPTTALDPRLPPTPTITATAGFSPTPTSTTTSIPTPSPTMTTRPTQTATPSPTPTLVSPKTPTSEPTFTSTPALAVVANTAGQGVNLRWLPAGPRAGALPEGSQVRILPGRESADGLEWIKVRDDLGRTGWIAAEYVVIIP